MKKRKMISVFARLLIFARTNYFILLHIVVSLAHTLLVHIFLCLQNKAVVFVFSLERKGIKYNSFYHIKFLLIIHLAMQLKNILNINAIS